MKKTSKLLLTSVLTIVMCISLIAGATFALFTDGDSVNIAVTSGKVDVEATVTGTKLYTNMYGERLDMEGNTWTNQGTATEKDGTVTLDYITPGDGIEIDIAIANYSSVATKYRVEISKIDDTGLFEALSTTYAFVANGETTASEMQFNDYVTKRFTDWTTLDAVTATDGKVIGTVKVTVELPWETSNDYQGESVTLVVKVSAVQSNAEIVDFMGWNGKTATADDIAAVTNEETKTISATSPAILAGIAEQVNSGGNSYQGYTIKLEENMDLDGDVWTPIGNQDHPFKGKFDGNGKNISNMTIYSSSSVTYRVGLFGVLNGATVSNLTISGAEIGMTNGEGALGVAPQYSGALAGSITNGNISNITIEDCAVRASQYGAILCAYTTGTVTDCTIKNSTMTATSSYIGGLSGQSYATFTNCTVEDCKIQGGWKTGGVVGQYNEGSHTMSNITVKNTDILVVANNGDTGMLVGFVSYGNQTFENCTVENCSIEREGAVSRLKNAGGLVGSFNTYARTYELNFINCHVNGITFKNGNQVKYAGGLLGGQYEETGTGVLTINIKDCSVVIKDVISEKEAPLNVGAFAGNFENLGANTTFNFEGNNTYSGWDNIIGSAGHIVNGEPAKA